MGGGSTSLLFSVLCIKRRQEVVAQDVPEIRKEAISHIAGLWETECWAVVVGKLFFMRLSSSMVKTKGRGETCFRTPGQCSSTTPRAKKNNSHTSFL